MDKTKTYIKQCEKAEEIQDGWIPVEGDWYKYHSGWCVEAVCIYHGKEIEEKDLGNPDIEPSSRTCQYKHKNYIWLPTQDRLQEMLITPVNTQFPDILTLLRFFNIFVAVNSQLTSMEQLWLAFVMQECYNKIWSIEKEEWIKENK